MPQGSCDSPRSLGEQGDSFPKLGEVGMTTLGFIEPLLSFEQVPKLMQLPTMPFEAPTNRMTNCISYRGGILGFAPQVCQLLLCVHFVFVV